MPTEEQVKECLGEILVPGAMRSLGRLNLVREINVSDKKVDITLARAALNSDTQEWLKSKISEGTGSLPGIEQANVGHSPKWRKHFLDLFSKISDLTGEQGD